MNPIAIIDYGMGNIESVINAFQRLNTTCIIIDKPQNLEQIAGIVLPGVGAFHAAMQNLHKRNLISMLEEYVIDEQKPLLGICLGMQLLAKDSEEIEFCQGLGWINGHVIKIEASADNKVPHVGWNNIQITKNSKLYSNLINDSHFFFDHSFHLQCSPEIKTAVCEYNGEKVVSIEHQNIFATQFHPEKSQRNGLKILRNFLNYAVEGRKC